MTTTRRRSPALLWLLLAAVLLVSLPPLCRHAVERHGRTAYSARRWVEMWEPDDDDDDQYWRGQQDDGRTVHILRLPELGGAPVTWAIVIVGGGCCVTAFLSQSREKVERKKRECQPEPEYERR